MSALIGVTVKTTRWAFLCDEVNFPLVVDACRKAYVPAAFSPLHDMDVWDRPAILNYCESWTYQRAGVLFFYDVPQSIKEGFTLKEIMQRPECPIFAAWPKDDKTLAVDSEHYEHIGRNGWDCFVRELPIVGEVKKPHYHCMVHLDSSKTREQLLAHLRLDSKQVYYWEPVGNPAGLLRYYAHMDNPEKAQYRRSDIVSVNGYDLSALYRKTEAGKIAEFEYLYSVIRSCPSRESNLMTMCDTLIANGRPEIAYALRSNSGFWKEIVYLQGKTAWSDDKQPDFKRSDAKQAADIDEETHDKMLLAMELWQQQLALTSNALVP